MTISSLISKMEKALFSPPYISLIKDIYSQLIESGEYRQIEADYQAARLLLPPHLTQEQRNHLVKYEALATENAEYCMEYGFIAGIQFAFQLSSGSERNVDDYISIAVEQALFRNPSTQVHQLFHSRKTQCLQIDDKLAAELSPNNYEHVVSIACAWDERIHFSCLYSVYLGYRTALNMLDRLGTLSQSSQLTTTLAFEQYLGLLKITT